MLISGSELFSLLKLLVIQSYGCQDSLSVGRLDDRRRNKAEEPVVKFAYSLVKAFAEPSGTTR